MRISDWSSDVCSSDLLRQDHVIPVGCHVRDRAHQQAAGAAAMGSDAVGRGVAFPDEVVGDVDEVGEGVLLAQQLAVVVPPATHLLATADVGDGVRSEEHTSELQSLMRISYAVFCLKKKNNSVKRIIT